MHALYAFRRKCISLDLFENELLRRFRSAFLFRENVGGGDIANTCGHAPLGLVEDALLVEPKAGGSNQAHAVRNYIILIFCSWRCATKEDVTLIPTRCHFLRTLCVCQTWCHDNPFQLTNMMPTVIQT